jgi:sec-independent protein translocase protein TatC
MSRMAMARRHDPDQFTMSFGEHLEELRRRVIYALIGLGVASLVTAWFGKDILLWLCQPLFESQRQLGLPIQVINLSVAGGFTVWMKVVLLAGLVLSAPWVVYQGWKFISAGLYAGERKFALLIAPFSTLMAVLGVFFLYYVFLPATVSFLLYFSATFPPPTSAAPTSLQRVTTFFNEMNRLFMPGTWVGHDANPLRQPDGGADATQPVEPVERPSEEGSGEVPGEDAGTARGVREEGGSPLRVPILAHDPASPHEGDIWFSRGSNQLKMRVGQRDRVFTLNAASMMIPQIEINEYLGLVFILALIVLIAFQLPVVMTLGAAIGILDPAWVSRYRKHIVFTFFVIGIIATPNQDFVGNILLPCVLWVLFELGLLTMRLVWKERMVEAETPTEE